MWPFKKNPYKCKYLEIRWEYPMPTLQYEHKFTNKPVSPDRSCGNLGMGYQCFDLDNKSDINKIARLNYGYKKQNNGVPYIGYDVIQLCADIHNVRELNNR